MCGTIYRLYNSHNPRRGVHGYGGSFSTRLYYIADAANIYIPEASEKENLFYRKSAK
jgi:hypothetical protein